MNTKQWYHKGLRFSCLRCGTCCRNNGEYTEVYVTGEDIRLMAEYEGIYPDQFRSRYVTTSDKFLVLTSLDGACCMLEDGLCRIYPARPRQCRTWPFWPENLSRRVWYNVARRRCPGVGKGRMYSEEEISEILRTGKAVP